MKNAVVRLVRLLVGLFYRRIEVTGLENLPRDGPVLLVANHANGLVDPMLVLRALPRPVVFVAKSTLWNIPVLRSLLDVLGCVPVVRKKDFLEGEKAAGPDRNEESLRRLGAVLEAGGCVLIFPEGRSHSDPRLSPMRTGAARVLLLSKKSPAVLPIGLWFTKKEEFRSDVLLRVGARVPPPAAPSVEAWTEAMGAALGAVTLNADDWKNHEVVAALDALYGEKIREGFLEGEDELERVGRSFRVRQLLLGARAALERTHPGEVATVARRVRALDHFLRRISLSFSSLDDPPPTPTILWNVLKALGVIAVGFPVAALGVATWWVPYRLCGLLANRVPGASEQRDQIALYKLIAGVILFPLFLAAWTAAAWAVGGAAWAALAFLFLPFAGILSLLFFEYASWRGRQARELLTLLVAHGAIARLRSERDALVAEIDTLAGTFRPQADNPRA